jgi:hypothetical protein
MPIHIQIDGLLGDAFMCDPISSEVGFSSNNIFLGYVGGTFIAGSMNYQLLQIMRVE